MKNPVASKISRRRVLRGMLNGTTVAVALPILDCLLNENGSAYAKELGGAPLPVIFGTWFWPLGLNAGQWEPDKAGSDFTFRHEAAVLNPLRDKLNVFSGLTIGLDGKANSPHDTTVGVIMTGKALQRDEGYAKSLDEVVISQMGTGRSRFPSLTVSCDGNQASTWSARGPGAMNPAEPSPIALYKRIFVDGFADPNGGKFTPDPRVLARRSVLSAVADERQSLMKLVGARDRERLDSLFTSVRDLEQKLALEAQPPVPLEACRLPAPPEHEHPGLIVGDVRETHRSFVKLLSYALACGQTRVFNVALSIGATNIHRVGDTSGYHLFTHEEPIDPKLGYQPNCHWFAKEMMAALADLITTLDACREGGGSLLDRTLVFGYTDHGEARLHSLKNLMLFTVGKAGNRMNTGMHVAAAGDSCARVFLTCQRALGLAAKSWGVGSNYVTEPYSQLLIGDVT